MIHRRFGWLFASLLALLLLAGLISAFGRRSADAISYTSYGPFAIGDPRSKIDQLAASRDYVLVGVFERTLTGATWTHHHVQGGPVQQSLTLAQLDQNRFWSKLGWTYPRTPPSNVAMVLAETRSWSLAYVYLYLDANGDVQAIYVGGS